MGQTSPVSPTGEELLTGSVRVRFLLWFSGGSEVASEHGGVSCAVLCSQLVPSAALS